MTGKNPHDTRYKKLFSNHNVVKQLMLSFVGEDWVKDLDFSSLERLDKSFITDEFREKESDIIYRINFKKDRIYLFLLIEFQSTVDRFMALRMLRYILEFYEDLLKNGLKKLPAIFPVMLYNGDRKWTAPLDIKGLIEHSIPVKYIPEFGYYKIAENEMPKDMLLKIENLLSAVFYIENSSPAEIRDGIEKITNLLKHEKPEELTLFINWLRHLFHYQENEITEKVRNLKGVKDMFSTALRKQQKEWFNEGLEKGIEKGMEKGKEKGLLQTATNLLKEGMAIEKISRISGLPVEKIKKLKKK